MARPDAGANTAAAASTSRSRNPAAADNRQTDYSDTNDRAAMNPHAGPSRRQPSPAFDATIYSKSTMAATSYNRPILGNRNPDTEQSHDPRLGRMSRQQQVLPPPPHYTRDARYGETQLRNNDLHEAISLATIFDPDHQSRQMPSYREQQNQYQGARRGGRTRAHSDPPSQFSRNNFEEYDNGDDYGINERANRTMPGIGKNRMDPDAASFAITEEYEDDSGNGMRDAMNVDVKPLKKRADEDRDSNNSDEYARFGLTELGKMDRQIHPKSAVKDKTLAELADPLIDKMSQIYANEWEDVITAEERTYKKTATGLGKLLNNELIVIAVDLSHTTQRVLTTNQAVKQAVQDETMAAHRKITEALVDVVLPGSVAPPDSAPLQVERKRLLERLKDNFERSASRDAKILGDVQAIRDAATTAMTVLDDEWIKINGDNDKKAKLVKNEKTLNQDFNNYLMKNMDFGGESNTKKSKGKKAGKA